MRKFLLILPLLLSIAHAQLVNITGLPPIKVYRVDNSLTADSVFTLTNGRSLALTHKYNIFGTSDIYDGNFNFGVQAGRDRTTGLYNTNIGLLAGQLNTTGSYNSKIGYQAGLACVTCSESVFLGGFNAGRNQTAGNNNIVIGTALDVPSLTGSNQLNIGGVIFGTGVNNATGGTSSVSTGSSIGLRVNAPARQVHFDGTGRWTNLGADVDDSTNWKPLAMNSSGDVIRFNRWAGTGSGGGGGTVTFATAAEINAGTESAKAIAPDQLAISDIVDQLGAKNVVTLSGSGATWTGTTTPSFTPVNGTVVNVIFGSAVSAAATLNLNSTAPRNIRITTSNIGGNQIAAGTAVSLMYQSSSNTWQVQNYLSDPNKLNTASPSPTGRTTVQGFSSAVSTVTSASTLSNTTAHTVFGNTTTAFTTTLPTAVGVAGLEYSLTRTGTNRWTIGTTSSQTINGASTYIFYGQYDAIKVKSDNANWIIVEEKNTQSGTYTPTVTAGAGTPGTNVQSASGSKSWWQRVGNTVTVYPQFSIDANMGMSSVAVDLTLPIPSTYSGTDLGQGHGMGSTNITGYFLGSGTAGRMTFECTPTVGVNQGYFGSFTYTIQ